MRKTGLMLCFALAALSLSAKDYKVELEAVPGEEQVFFLELSGTGADSSTFQLTGPDGREIPFSFDMRIARPETPGKFNPPADGFHSRVSAPASEERFMKPGYLSFRRETDAKRYTLTFRDGAEKTLPRPNPAVRAFWIELVRDPDLKEKTHMGVYRGTLKMLPGGGVEFDRPFSINRQKTTAFRADMKQADPRICGRRIIGLVRCEGPFSFWNVILKNAVRKDAVALSCYFTPQPGVILDLCSEGILDKDQSGNSNPRFFNTEYVKGPCRIYCFHVQLPPSDHAVGVKLKSDIVNLDEMISLEPFGLGCDNIMPFESGGIKGYRVGRWEGRPDARYSLRNAEGKVVKSGSGLQFKLSEIREGRYHLDVELLINGIPAIRQTFPLTVQRSPF